MSPTLAAAMPMLDCIIAAMDARDGDPDLEPDNDGEDGHEDCCEAGDDRGRRL